MESKEVPRSRLEKNPSREKEMESQRSATNLTMELASTNTSVKSAASPVTERKSAWTGANEIYRLQPKYLCHNLWQEGSHYG